MSDVKTKILPGTFQPNWFKNCVAWYDVNHTIATSGWDSPTITWTSLTNVSTTSNSVTDTFGSDAWSSGAHITNNITGNGDVTFTTSDNTTHKMFGLSNTWTFTIGSTYTTIQYALYMAAGGIEVYENGTLKFTGGTYAAGDNFTVRVMGTTVTYYHNGTLIYTSATAATLPLQAGFAGFSNGGTVSNIILNNYVSSITDLSGAGNNLTITSGSTYKIATQSGANNKLGINFDGSGCLAKSTALITGTDSPVTYFLVSQTSNTANDLFAFFNGDPSTGGSGYIINDGGTSRRSWYATNAGPAWSATTALPTTFEITTWINVGSAVGKQLYVNGTLTSLTASTGADPTITNDNFSIGGWSGSSLAWQGVICEFVAYSVAMTANQITEISRYLGTKYGITVA